MQRSPEGASYSPGALKFGAGTPNVSGPVGLAAAIRFIERVGADAIWRHEQSLTRHALGRLLDIRGLRIIGPKSPAERIAVFSFAIDGVSPQDLVVALDAPGIAIRGGDLAALPLLKRFGVTRAARASLYLYTTIEEIDRLADALSVISRTSCR